MRHGPPHPVTSPPSPGTESWWSPLYRVAPGHETWTSSPCHHPPSQGTESWWSPLYRVAPGHETWTSSPCHHPPSQGTESWWSPLYRVAPGHKTWTSSPCHQPPSPRVLRVGGHHCTGWHPDMRRGPPHPVTSPPPPGTESWWSPLYRVAPGHETWTSSPCHQAPPRVLRVGGHHCRHV